MAMTSLGNKLQELRNSLNLTQQQVSEALNVGRASYAYYELDKRTPDLQTLMLLCKLYQVDITELINENTIPIPANINENIVQSSSAYSTAAVTNIFNRAKMNTHYTKKEKDLIIEFRRLSPDNQEEILHMIRYKSRKQKK